VGGHAASGARTDDDDVEFVAHPAIFVSLLGRVKRSAQFETRVDEVRACLRVAKELANAGRSGAVGAMTALLMGMRCSEVVRCALSSTA
jgi:hypothetical protein